MMRSWVVFIANFFLVVIISICAWFWSRPKGPQVPPQSPDTTLANLDIKVIEAKESEMGESFVKVQLCNTGKTPVKRSLQFDGSNRPHFHPHFQTDTKNVQLGPSGLESATFPGQLVIPPGHCSSQIFLPLVILDTKPNSLVTFRLGYDGTIWSEPITMRVHKLPVAKSGDLTIWDVEGGKIDYIRIGLLNRQLWPIAVDVDSCEGGQIGPQYLITDNQNARFTSACSNDEMHRRRIVIRPVRTSGTSGRLYGNVSLKGKPGASVTFRVGLLLSGKAHQVKQRPALLKDAIWSDPVTLKGPVE